MGRKTYVYWIGRSDNEVVRTERRNKQFFVALFMICIVLHAFQFYYNRSLWIDEAMLASSVMTREFGNLVATPLDWGQSAPI